jgi:mono/diheme cytochrome c family protein
MREIDDDRMFRSIKFGRPETAMKPFEGILRDIEIKSIIAFIRHTFIEKKAENILYHSPENQWEDFQQKYPEAIAYFLYQGDESELTEELEIGKMYFDTTCVSCHLVRKRPGPGEGLRFHTEGD